MQPYYIAPEVLRKNYNEKCDIWSCGVVLYMMLSDSPPFKGKTTTGVLNSVLKGKYSFDGFENVSEEAKDLIRGMMEIDTEKRFSAMEALQHKWIQNSIRKLRKKPNEKVLENLRSLNVNFFFKLFFPVFEQTSEDDVLYDIA